MRLPLVALIAALISTSTLQAETLGLHGRSWPIAEPDFEDVIRERLGVMEKNGEIEKHQKIIEKRARASVNRPTPVSGLSVVRKNRSRLFDPSIITTRNLDDGQGNLIAPQGTIVNPLKYVSLPAPVMLFDSDDDRQIEVAKKQIAKEPRTILLLTNGSFLETRKSLKHKVFFDQQGQFVKRFEITRIPSLITQDGMRLRIYEIAP